MAAALLWMTNFVMRWDGLPSAFPETPSGLILFARQWRYSK
jgi:hypothetical protein